MPIRVLVVEPDQPLLESFKEYFSKHTPFDVRYTGDGEECIALVESFRPHVLLLEMALPRGAAESILESIGATSEGPVVPVLVLTNRPNWIEQGHPSINELHVKPQSMRLIRERIEALAQLN